MTTEWFNKAFIYGGSVSTGVSAQYAQRVSELPSGIWLPSDKIALGVLVIIAGKFAFDVIKFIIERREKVKNRDGK